MAVVAYLVLGSLVTRLGLRRKEALGLADQEDAWAGERLGIGRHRRISGASDRCRC